MRLSFRKYLKIPKAHLPYKILYKIEFVLVLVLFFVCFLQKYDMPKNQEKTYRNEQKPSEMQKKLNYFQKNTKKIKNMLTFHKPLQKPIQNHQRNHYFPKKYVS